MSEELIIGAIVGVGAIASIVIPVLIAIFNSLRGIQRDIAGLHRDNGDLRERMARLEGLFEGFTGRTDKPATA